LQKQKQREVSLVVGLGNPGTTYEKTRHNVGGRALKLLAERYGLELRRKLLLQAKVVRGAVLEHDVVLLQPLAYMNMNGPVIAKALRIYGVSLERVLVLVDDITLPFGELRLRGQGGAGGHNGLKSVEAALGTNHYARLRIGVGDRKEGDLADYVLSPFTQEEEKLVLPVLERATKVIELWFTEGLNRAMNEAHLSS
jgi:PTH1 family peptidyl-tRNA hydrolase